MISNNANDLLKKSYFIKIKSEWKKHNTNILGLDDTTGSEWECKADIYLPDKTTLVAENKTIISIGRAQMSLNQCKVDNYVQIYINPCDLSADEVLV